MLIWNDKNKHFIGAAAAILLLLFFHLLGWLQPVESLLSKILSPILSRGFDLSVKIGDIYLLAKNKSELVKENADLKAQLTSNLKARSLCLSSEEENEFLRQQLNYSPPQNFEFKIARVIGKNFDEAQNTLIVEAGSDDGVSLGLPVLTGDGVMIGKIFKVNPKNSFVLLINDDLSRVAVKIQNQAKTLGLLEGQYGQGIHLKYIPQNEPVKESDLVVTSGLESSVPPNLLIGQISTISAEPEALFKEAAVSSLVDFNKITLVNILIKKNVD